MGVHLTDGPMPLPTTDSDRDALAFLRKAAELFADAQNGEEVISTEGHAWSTCSVTISAPALARLLCASGVIEPGWPLAVDIMHGRDPRGPYSWNRVAEDADESP